MARREIYISDFSTGLVTKIPAHLLPDGATPATVNWDLSDSLGVLTKRKGQATVSDQHAAGAKVVGLHEYVQSDGDKFNLAAYNDDVYNVPASGAWTSIFTAAAMNGAETNFVTFNDNCIFFNANITTQVWTGTGGSTNLGGTPPSNVKYGTKHANRVVLANSSSGNSRVHWSKLNDGADWTATGDTGATFLDIQDDDGDQITGVASLGSVLIVFKKFSTHAVYGYKPSNFVARILSPSVGCVSNRSIVVTDSMVIFLAHNGVYGVGLSGPPVLLSDAIQPTIDALSDTVKVGAAAGHLRHQYWLAYDSDGGGNNDKAYIFDYLDGIWFQYDTITANCFVQTNTGLLYSGGSDNVVLRQHDTTSDDVGTAITATWDSPLYGAAGRYEEDSFVHDKQLHDFHLFAEASSGKTVSMRTLLNGVLQAETVSFSLTATDPSSSASNVTVVTNTLESMQARLFQFRLSNAEASFRPKIYAYSTAFEVRERQN